jgi:CDP-4-dehydro-6-deoxyglucose reductase/ferredoxin-NAD(P)+ reductase (naphthalene dioxygenase ferredoxin-specific)
VLELEYSAHALSAEERAKGLVLACRTQVWDDTTVRRLDDEELVVHPSRVLRCRVCELKDLTRDIKAIRLAVESGGPMTFTAGQYAQLEFAEGPSRHYSMASTPRANELEFHVRHVPGGRTSGYVATRLKAGDPVKMSGPLGISYLRENHSGPVLLVAGGSGLAPIESILRTLLSRNHAAPVSLYFGVRAERDVYHEALLKELAAVHSNFRYEIVLSDEASDTRRTGLVHEAIALSRLDDLMAYLAGPPPMVEAATDALRARGVPARRIHADAFYDQR